MRPTLALSGMLLTLLLLLLLPSPSLSENNGSSAVTNKPVSQNIPVNTTVLLIPTSVTSSKQDKHTVTTTLPPNPQNTTAIGHSLVPSTQPPTTGVPTSISASDKSRGNSPATIPSGFQDDEPKTSAPTTTTTERPAFLGGQSSDSSSTTSGNPVTTTAPTQPTDAAKIPQSLPTSPIISTASPPQLTDATLKTAESSPETQHNLTTTVANGSSTTESLRMPATQTQPVTTEEPQTTPSTTLDGFTPTFPTTLHPREPPVGTDGTPAADEFTSPSTNLTPTAPQDPSTPSPTWTFGNYKVKCDPAIMPDLGLLMLNLTGASLCGGSPLDEKLAKLLCHSVKASFNTAQDKCTLQVAPVLESQALAVKTVIIETKLLSKDVFERFKDKWDDLREAGVSDMHLGKEGPPEPNEDRFSMPLIVTIVCMASFLLLVAALYGCCHQRVSQRKDQQRLTEELQTVENGYHDNPTLEVMETSSEMQEKKVVNLNGELGDSWIVPLDNLTKDDLDEEEDTHL